MAEEIPQAQIEKDEARKRYEFKKALEKLIEHECRAVFLHGGLGRFDVM